MRIMKKYKLGDYKLINTKFSMLTSQELYGRQLGELLMRSWDLKG